MLRVAARPSSCGWCWLSVWPIPGWALLSGNCGSGGCRGSRSPRPPRCRSGRWHYRACWSLEWAGWPAEAPYRRAQSSWTPLYWENWREMGNWIIQLSGQMCFCMGTQTTHEWVKTTFSSKKGPLYLQAAEKWAFPCAVCIHGDNAWYKWADHWRPKCWRNTVRSFWNSERDKNHISK